MILKRCFTSLPASPVTGIEFTAALRRIWGADHSTSPNLGLAISGGVDSMALAALCARELPWQGEIVAFVVDHAARENSGEEAERVVESLRRQLGLHARKLSLRWPTGTRPLELPNFETVARQLRFRALGNACAAMGIDTMLLGHHQDDQAETAFMRLANGASSYGLKGIAVTSNVPECQGIHGVHESQRKAVKSLTMGHVRDLRDWTPPLPEIGGIEVARPLLGMTKPRLVATCRHHKIDWFEDHTNADRTLTSRNAVRHIFQSFTLPKAISKAAMIGTSARAEQEQAAVDTLAERMFSLSKVRLDTRIGTLTVTLPEAVVSKLEVLQQRQRMAAFAYVKRLVRIVTSSKTVELDQLGGAVKMLYPELSPAALDASVTEQTLDTLTCAGVIFHRLGDRSWRLTRALPPSHLAQSFNITIAKPTDAFAPVLFDNRYWIDLRCGEFRRPLVIRFLREYDIPYIRAYFKDPSRRKIHKLEAVRVALDPGSLVTSAVKVDNEHRLAKMKMLRGVIPVIALADNDGDVLTTTAERYQTLQNGMTGLGAGSLVALPTLGIALTDLFKDSGWNWLQNLRFGVRYRKVDFGSHDMEQVLVMAEPGIGQNKAQPKLKRQSRRSVRTHATEKPLKID